MNVQTGTATPKRGHITGRRHRQVRAAQRRLAGTNRAELTQRVLLKERAAAAADFYDARQERDPRAIDAAREAMREIRRRLDVLIPRSRAGSAR